MKQWLTNDVTKIILYFVFSFLLAAIITPWLYNAGQFAADLAKRGDSNALIEYLGPHAERAEFSRYFKRSLALAALLLLIPLIFTLRMSRPKVDLLNSAFSDYLPDDVKNAPRGQSLIWKTKLAPLHLIFGFLLAAGLLFLGGKFLVTLGYFADTPDYDLTRALRKSTTAAIGAALFEELLFRGILLGIFLRTFRIRNAIIFVSIIFAALHFLQPPSGFDVPNPRYAFSGFQMLGLLGERFFDLPGLVYEFCTLLIVGLILGYARVQTAGLWLPIGLHAGWVFAFKLFNYSTDRLDGPNEKPVSLLLGSDLKEGFIPLALLAITGFLLIGYHKLLHKKNLL